MEQPGKSKSFILKKNDSDLKYLSSQGKNPIEKERIKHLRENNWKNQIQKKQEVMGFKAGLDGPEIEEILLSWGNWLGGPIKGSGEQPFINKFTKNCL